MVTLEKNTHATKFGFRFNRGGTHLSSTMMLEELSSLLGYINDPNADKKTYLKSIKADNCLGKRSGKTCELTSRHLVGLYSLDTTDILFRTLLFFWHRDPAGHPEVKDPEYQCHLDPVRAPPGPCQKGAYPCHSHPSRCSLP